MACQRKTKSNRTIRGGLQHLALHIGALLINFAVAFLVRKQFSRQSLKNYLSISCAHTDDDYFTYLNPCWAGCRSPSTLPLAASSTSSDSNVSLQCAFTPPTDDTPHSYRPAQFERGICRRDCAIALALFVVAVYVIAFLLALSKVCSLLLTLRSVEQQSRSLALALQLVFLRVFAYIPAPILFGLAIDRQ